jgi:site-specific DNA-methyltransferase (adenine-specific)
MRDFERLQSGDQSYVLLCGDSLELLKSLPDCSIDAVVTDPPAGIAFMGTSRWDNFRNKDGGSERENFMAFIREAMGEVIRVLKPGAHALVWALPRTEHWTAMAIEDVGFEIREKVSHVFSTGMPKTHNISKQIDKMAGAKRKVIGQNINQRGAHKHGSRGFDKELDGENIELLAVTEAATEEAKKWEGWSTAIKPSNELWILCRKPMSEKNIASNVLRWGTGGLNVDACRSTATEKLTRKLGKTTESASGWKSVNRAEIAGSDKGRWPKNLVFSHHEDCTDETCVEGCVVPELDKQSGISKSRSGKPRRSQKPGEGYGMVFTGAEYDDEGGASRYFEVFRYSKKPTTKEKDLGLDDFYWKKAPGTPTGYSRVSEEEWEVLPAKERVRGNIHSTVKGIDLMRWLCRLITPPGGIVLDPFAGSGTTGIACIRESFRFLGIEKEPEYYEICKARVEAVAGEPVQLALLG